MKQTGILAAVLAATLTTWFSSRVSARHALAAEFDENNGRDLEELEGLQGQLEAAQEQA